MKYLFLICLISLGAIANATTYQCEPDGPNPKTNSFLLMVDPSRGASIDSEELVAVGDFSIDDGVNPKLLQLNLGVISGTNENHIQGISGSLTIHDDNKLDGALTYDSKFWIAPHVSKIKCAQLGD